MINATFTFDKNQFNSLMSNINLKIKNTTPFMKIWSTGVAKLASQCARKKSSSGQFWNKVASRIRATNITSTTATIRASHPGSMLHEYGGTVRPVEAKSLAIPISRKAKGKRPKSFRNLVYIPSRKGQTTGLLVNPIGRKNKGFELMYILRKSAKIPKNPWFPSKKQILTVGIKEGRRFLKELQQG